MSYSFPTLPKDEILQVQPLRRQPPSLSLCLSPLPHPNRCTSLTLLRKRRCRSWWSCRFRPRMTSSRSPHSRRCGLSTKSSSRSLLACGGRCGRSRGPRAQGRRRCAAAYHLALPTGSGAASVCGAGRAQQPGAARGVHRRAQLQPGAVRLPRPADTPTAPVLAHTLAPCYALEQTEADGVGGCARLLHARCLQAGAGPPARSVFVCVCVSAR